MLEHGLTGVGIIEAYYRRRVAPLMSRPVRLFGMAPTVSEALLRPSLVSRAFPSEEEIRSRLEELLGKERADALEIPTPGQPSMLPDPGAVDLVSLASFVRFSFFFLPGGA